MTEKSKIIIEVLKEVNDLHERSGLWFTSKEEYMELAIEKALASSEQKHEKFVEKLKEEFKSIDNVWYPYWKVEQVINKLQEEIYGK
jgi:hypothetical protein